MFLPKGKRVPSVYVVAICDYDFCEEKEIKSDGCLLVDSKETFCSILCYKRAQIAKLIRVVSIGVLLSTTGCGVLEIKHADGKPSLEINTKYADECSFDGRSSSITLTCKWDI